MEPFGRCLDPDDVDAFVHGALNTRDVVVLEAHVAQCHDCRTLLSLVARSDSVASSVSREASAAIETTLVPVDADPSQGTRIGRYVLRERLGAGAMGVVFAARDPELDREVAVKLLRSDRSIDAAPALLTARLLREAQAMAQLAHPNVVAVHDVGWFGDRIFIAMELVQGPTLAQWLAAERRPLREVIAMFIAAGHGLAAAHAAGLVHRDFKPENVLVGKEGRARVTDFGLAHRAAMRIDPAAGATHVADRRRTTTGLIAGTPFYMAPEQLVGDRVDARSDQFSFCVAIYAALTGRHPFPPSGRAGDAFADPPRRDGLPRWLWRALRPGLALERDRRHPSMEALLSTLATGPRRQRWLWFAAAVATATLAGVVYNARTGVNASDRGPRCDGAAQLLAGVWDLPRAEAIGEVFHATRRPDAAAAFSSASLLLDQYANRWIAMRTEACEHPRLHSDLSEAAVNLRIQCLDARRSELRLLTDRLAAADGAVVDRALVDVQALGALNVCADDGVLQRPTQPDVAARPGATAALDAAQRLSYFDVDADGLLWQVRQSTAGAEPDRLPTLDGIVGRPAVVMDGQRRLQLFVRRVEQRLWHAHQDVPGGAWKVELLTDAVTDDPAAAIASEQLVYFVRKTDGWLWRYWQDPSSAGGWSAVRVTDAVTGVPGVGFDVAGALYSFVRKADGSLWYARHPGPVAPPERPVKLTEHIAGDPIVMRDTAGKLTYFVRRDDGWLITGYQHAAGIPVWHFVSLVTSGAAGDPAVAFDAEGKQVCMIRRTDGALWFAIQDTPSTGPWHDAILASGIAGDPTLVLGTDNRLRYLVRKTDGRRWQGEQDAPLAPTWREHAVP